MTLGLGLGEGHREHPGEGQGSLPLPAEPGGRGLGGLWWLLSQESSRAWSCGQLGLVAAPVIVKGSFGGDNISPGTSDFMMSPKRIS